MEFYDICYLKITPQRVEINRELKRKVFCAGGGTRTIGELVESPGVLHRVRWVTRKNEGGRLSKITSNLGLIFRDGHEVKGIAPCIFGFLTDFDTIEEVERYSLKI